MSNFFVSVAPGTSFSAQLIVNYLIVSGLTVTPSHSKSFWPSLRTAFFNMQK